MKVLSIDGGGVRGIIPARILQEIETRTGKHVSKIFDIISGASTGGLLALGLAKANAEKQPAFFAKDILDIYLNCAKKILVKPSIFRKITTGFGLWGSKYDRTNYDKILSELFQDSLLSKTLCPIFIPIYSLIDDKPFICSTIFAVNNKENDFYLRDIAGATSAAPTYFEPKVFKSPNDGKTYQGSDEGIYANNPVLVGIIGAYLTHAHFELDNIILLSLGTGEAVKKPKYDNSNYGDIGWLKNKDIIGDMIDANSILAETAIRAVLKMGNHFRFQMELPDELLAMDNSDNANLKALLQKAEEFIQQNSRSIDGLCEKLTT